MLSNLFKESDFQQTFKTHTRIPNIIISVGN